MDSHQKTLIRNSYLEFYNAADDLKGILDFLHKNNMITDKVVTNVLKPIDP